MINELSEVEDDVTEEALIERRLWSAVYAAAYAQSTGPWSEAEQKRVSDAAYRAVEELRLSYDRYPRMDPSEGTGQSTAEFVEMRVVAAGTGLMDAPELRGGPSDGPCILLSGSEAEVSAVAARFGGKVRISIPVDGG